MADTRISAVDYTNLNNKDQTSETRTDFRRVIETAEQDLPGSTFYPNWSKWFGFYKKVPELQAVVNKKAIWTLGRGFRADSKTTKLLQGIKGNGKDTFNSIMNNQVVVYTVGGDSFAEIIRNKRGVLRNLKPMNPGSIGIVTNEKGIITKYLQTIRSGNFTKKIEFNPEDIFHLSWNRLGDEPHGRSTIEKLEDIIEMKNEAMIDMRIVFHRYVKPLILVRADTDDETEITNLKAKLDNAVEKMENMIIPKDSLEMERMSIPQYSTLDPLPWIELLQKFFILAEGVPEVILGLGKDTTEASSKILYLAFQQNIEHNQRFLEEQIKAQLKLDVEFNFPADLAGHMQGDMRKEGNLKLEGDKPVRRK